MPSVQANVLHRAGPLHPRRRSRILAGAGAHVTLARCVMLLAIVIVWELLAARSTNVAMVSSPSEIIATLFSRILSDPQIQVAIAVTVYEVVAAYVLSIVFGILVGLAIGWTSLVRRTFFPVVLLLYAIPQVILLPLFVLVFGIGPAPKIAFGFTHGIFPIVVNIIAGMRNIDPLYVRAARAQGASALDMARHVYLPHMVSSLFAGLRLAMTLTLLGVILAELYVSTTGIGYLTRVFTETYEAAPLYALIAVLAVMAVILNEIVRIAERRFTRWKA